MSDLINWRTWHDKYQTDEGLKARLETVKSAIKSCLPRDNSKTFTLIDIGAGDGRDIVEALKDYPTPSNVRGLLVEIDQALADKAREALHYAKLTNLLVRMGDASLLRNYKDQVPVDLVLLCGIFGNISDIDAEKTVKAMPMLLKPGGKVIWTRNRRAPDKTPFIRELFKSNDMREVEFITSENIIYAVGINEYSASNAVALDEDAHLFTFIR